MTTVRVETKASDFALTHIKGVLVCDFMSNKIRTSPARFINSRLRQIFKDNPGFVHSRVESGKITVLTTSTRALQDVLTTGKRIIEETRDVTRVYISGTQCVSRSSLLGILNEHVGRVATDSLRLSSWMQHQSHYGDIAFADVILGDGVSLPITFEVVEEGEAVGSFTVDQAKAKAADAEPPPRQTVPQGRDDGWRSHNTVRRQGAARRPDPRTEPRPSNNHSVGRSTYAIAARGSGRHPGSFRAEDFDDDQDSGNSGLPEAEEQAPGTHADPPPSAPPQGANTSAALQGVNTEAALQGTNTSATPAPAMPQAPATVANNQLHLGGPGEPSLEPVLEAFPATAHDSFARAPRGHSEIPIGNSDSSLNSRSCGSSSSSSSSSSSTINSGRSKSSTGGKGPSGGRDAPPTHPAPNLQPSRRLSSQGSQLLSAAQRSAAPASRSDTRAKETPPGARTRSRSKEPGRTADTGQPRNADSQGRRLRQ